MRVVFILLLLNCTAYSDPLTTTQIPHPIFLKLGFSSIIDFSEVPIRVVVGDSQSFQVEKIDKSLVVRALVPYATTNLFVYFKTAQSKLFTLSASEDSNPSLYSKFDLSPPKPIEPKMDIKAVNKKSTLKSGVQLKTAKFDKSKDYLTIDFLISADAMSLLKPKWDLIRLVSGKNKFAPHKVWSERQQIQKDSSIKARLIFLRPNIDKALKNCFVIIPLIGRPDVFHLNLKKGN